ncbi:MAG: hypothetical protein IPK60_09385 [Sandaracinaceae bacterium]|nr:hypothetical protein [Sandaracinaceae bacterium]
MSFRIGRRERAFVAGRFVTSDRISAFDASAHRREIHHENKSIASELIAIGSDRGVGGIGGRRVITVWLAAMRRAGDI